MLTRQRGRIVNVSSGAGCAAIPMLSAYAVSKAALYRLSENLAAETRGHGVMVFAIDPGLVRTAMSESALSCGEPGIEQWFTDAFASQEDVSTEPAATLVVDLASGAADVLTPHRLSALRMAGRRRPRRSSKSAPGAGHAVKRRSAGESAGGVSPPAALRTGRLR